jgi:acetyl esterase/lipase
MTPQGPELQIFVENFDDPDVFSSESNVIIPSPWLQEGAGNSPARISAQGSAPSLPNMVKIDATDALTLPLDLTGYGNISISYYTRASSYISGSIVVEWSTDGGDTWALLEDFKLPEGTEEQKNSQSNTQKTWSLTNEADSNANVRLRFRVGDPMLANMYFDNLLISGQAIPGIPPALSPIPMPDPDDTPPFVPPAGVVMHEDVEIGMAGDRPIFTSIAVPTVAPEEPMPVIVYIHGGGWNHGDRKSALTSISNYVRNRGYIGVSVSYRLTGEAPFPAQIQDVKLAIRYLRAHAEQYYIDPERIGVWGSSAGGHLAALLGTTADWVAGEMIELDNGNTVASLDLEGTGGWSDYSSRVHAIANWYGPADFTSEFANNYSSVTALLGGNRAFTVPDLARLAMPGTYATEDDSPFWIRHGDADATVPYEQSLVLNEQLTAADVVVDLLIVPGQGHGFVGEAKTQANIDVWEFFEEYVKNR